MGIALARNPPLQRAFSGARVYNLRQKERVMKLGWHKPIVLEQEVGMEVASYASAELRR